MNELALQAFHEELEKIAYFDAPAAVAGAALTAAVLAGAQARDARQDRMLVDMGHLHPYVARERSRRRKQTMAAVAAAGGAAVGLGTNYARKQITNRAAEYVKSTLDPTMEAAKNSINEMRDEAVKSTRKELDDMLKRQAQYGQKALKDNLKDMKAENVEEAGASLVRGFLNPFRWGKK